MEKDLTYEKLYSVNTNKPSTNMNTTQRNQIKLVIKELDNWCNNFINQREKEVSKKNYFNVSDNKPLSTIGETKSDKSSKFFKNEEEVRNLIMYVWCGYLITSRLPKYHDGKTLRRVRRELIKELSTGKLVTADSIKALTETFNKIKEF